jgi:hypothetical protein
LRKQVLTVGLPTPQTLSEGQLSERSGLQTRAHQKTAWPRDMRILQRSPSAHGLSRQSPWESARH